MASLRETFGELQALQKKFQDALLAERAAQPVSPDNDRAAPPAEKAVTGDNPGALRMYLHAPATLPKSPALVVALHGCGQSAAEYARGTGWSALADRLGFVVLYPEQQSSNNGQKCFSWFVPGHTGRGGGEARSIHSMIDQAVNTYGIDQKKIFVTGLSAGGAMASVMLATYPELFAGGSVIAGLPFGAARSVQEAFQAMMNQQTLPAAMLGDRVRNATDHQGPWPKVSVWHGTNDSTVHPSNAGQIAAQWLNVHDLHDEAPDVERMGRHHRSVWRNKSGDNLVEVFHIEGMGHGVPLALSGGVSSCGAPGPFFIDAGISSTHYSAHAWGLTGQEAAVVAANEVRAEDARPAHAWHLDPAQIVAAALRQAGLGGGQAAGEAARKRSPAAIIEAALRAAGIKS
jgi:poly(hydroxyalkanoate) depolymerase family esterase